MAKTLIERYIKELNEILKSASADLISAMIIYPSDVSLKKLTRKLIVKNSSLREKYKEFEEDYVTLDKNDPGKLRTLTFLKYEESVKYESVLPWFHWFQKQNYQKHEQDIYYPYDFDEFDLETDTTDLRNEDNLKPFWNAWKRKIKKHFPEAKSTLWSYVVLRRQNEQNEPIICSAYFIFSGDIGKDKSIIINKINQDYLYLFVTEHFYNDIQRQANKAAIIQYMARNLSHNTGSHLIPEAIEYFKQYLKNDTGEKETLELKEKFAYYQKYTQERMELLAQLSSMRDNHNWTNYNFNEIIEEFEKSIVPKGLCDDLNKNLKGINISIKDNTTNAFVALPDGAVGKQAFYVILENFIRNAYKHSTPKDNDGQKQYEFELKISEPPYGLGMEGFWCIDMYDKLGTVAENAAKRTPDKLTDLKSLIESSVLTNGQLRERGWGILEMKSAAAFLSGQSLELLDELSSEYFQANYYDDDGKIEEASDKRNIGHRFYLPKPKLLIIDKSIATNAQKQDETGLKTKGIIILKIDLDTVKKMPHQFIITESTLGFSNHKILKTNIDTSKDLATVENALWEKYLSEKDRNNTKIVATNNGLNNDKNTTAYFDSHGKVLTLDNGNNLKNANKSKIDGLGLFYYHPFKSRSKIQELIKSVSEHRFKGLLLEGVFNKVLIIDERIQNAANSMDNDQSALSVKDIFSLIGVDIPSQNLSDYLEKPVETIREELLGLIKDNKYKYVILHLTILEKMSGKSKKDELKAYIDDDKGIDEKNCFDEKNRAFVLVSGRGQPPNLPDLTFYINYTTLYDCLMYRMSKPHLMQTLLTLRK